MKYAKYIIMAVTFSLWLFDLLYFGAQTGSAYIQFVDGLIIVAGSGAAAHWIPEIIKFVREHRAFMKRHHEFMDKHEQHMNQQNKKHD